MRRLTKTQLRLVKQALISTERYVRDGGEGNRDNAELDLSWLEYSDVPICSDELAAISYTEIVKILTGMLWESRRDRWRGR